ncbi:carbamoyltransferase C-terminal domain-containing protein [soil metagenome]
MKTLGIVYGHNASLCLMENGEIIFCQSEERLNRIKGSGGFPSATLKYVYDNIASADSIDQAVLYETEFQFQYSRLKELGFQPTRAGYSAGSDPVFQAGIGGIADVVRHNVVRTAAGQALQERRRSRIRRAMIAGSGQLRAEALSYFAGVLQLPESRIAALDHHLAHTYSVLPNLAHQPDTLVFTLDGWGDGVCATVGRVRNGRIEILSRDDEVHSLGTYYRLTTLILGMMAVEDEYKVMGLAAYARLADYRDIYERLRSMLTVDDAGRWRSRFAGRVLFRELEQLFRHRRFDHVAGAIQHLAERLVVEWIGYWIHRTGCRRVALAGGVFMNVKVSQRVMDMDAVEFIFIMPAASDESTAIGCAAWAQAEADVPVPLKPLGPLYLGIDFSDDDVRRAMQKTEAASRYDISQPDDMSSVVVDLLARNEIVARCSGRMEFGPRALGNRSILAHPAEMSNVARINKAIKVRDFWMPFAPSILEEDMADYVVNHSKVFAPYMCVAFDSVPAARGRIAAALHSHDHTVRPQAVRRTWNPEYHEIIQRFKERTGIGAVLNTSFNLHGEPIVCSPEDAIQAVDASGLEHLVLGNLLLTKRPAVASRGALDELSA